MPDSRPALSIILCTYNRAALLERALAALARARTSDAEIVVVDNNSTDDTRRCIARFENEWPGVRGIHEPRQGLSHARNAGIAAARGDTLAFTDDDVEVEVDWIAALLRAFDRFTTAAWIGGKVLPLWPSPPPEWLDRSRWAPLALVDYGDEPLVVGRDRPLSLVGANFAVRKDALNVTGLFSSAVQRVGGGCGTTEDHELQLRLITAGFTGVYDPALVVRAPIDPSRMTTSFHRRWHFQHGRSFARMSEATFERTRHRVFGIPGHVVRTLPESAINALLARARVRSREALTHELRATFAAGFIAERLTGPRVPLAIEPLAAPAESTARSRVSIVIPCFNQSRFLKRAIDSALNQTVGPTEIVVVDDGSTDDTAAIARQFSSVRYHRQPNRGVAAARNAGLARCSGDYVIFLDADDELLCDAAQVGFEALAANPEAAFAAGASVPIDDRGLEQPCVEPPLTIGCARLYEQLLTTNFVWTPGAAIFRRALLLRSGGFDESLSASADYDSYLRLGLQWPIVWHGRRVVRYRRHAGAMSADPAAMLRETLQVLRRQRRLRKSDRRQWRHARRAWQEWYGDQIAHAVKTALGERNWKSAVRSLAVLARLYPAGALKHGWRAVSRRVQAGVATRAVEIVAPTTRGSASSGSRSANGTSRPRRL